MINPRKRKEQGEWSYSSLHLYHRPWIFHGNLQKHTLSSCLKLQSEKPKDSLRTDEEGNAHKMIRVTYKSGGQQWPPLLCLDAKKGGKTSILPPEIFNRLDYQTSPKAMPISLIANAAMYATAVLPKAT